MKKNAKKTGFLGGVLTENNNKKENYIWINDGVTIEKSTDFSLR